MPTETEKSIFNARIRSLVLRKQFELENIYMNNKKGIVIAEEFIEVDPSPVAQQKHLELIMHSLKEEGFSYCGPMFGYNKI